MADWQTEKAERNRKSFARLSKALPTVFPPAVLARALDRPFIPPTPRLAIGLYWRAHPIRADRLARALAVRTGPPGGWAWRLSQSRKDGLPTKFRTPPAPYRERAYSFGSGLLLRLRSARLPTRLARGSVGRRIEQESRMALWRCARAKRHLDR
jgi:hypothetical protein